MDDDLKIVPRLLQVPDRSFFLFGPRGTGKSTWLRQALSHAAFFDLLDASLYLELARDPHALEALVGRLPAGSWVVLDEIQKIPPLLDEVHRLMAARRWRFALCGSSARKLRRSGANLLAGRALTLTLEPFSAAEMGDAFNLDSALEWGLLPFVQNEPSNASATLAAYVNTYLKEEIREEGIVRKVAPFVRFLTVAGQLNGQVVRGQKIARDAGVPRSTADVYFSVFEDTLLGHFLPSWQPQAKVRERARPKLYWFDPGVARAAAGLHLDPPDRTWLGFALETLVYHELRVFNETAGRHRPIAYYGTASGTEIDFIVETRKGRPGAPPHAVCIEVKLASRWDRAWERAARGLKASPSVVVDRMLGVYTGPRRYHSGGFDVLPVADFLDELHAGRIF
jgi:predicted AAA+ superfamily ATPase